MYLYIRKEKRLSCGLVGINYIYIDMDSLLQTLSFPCPLGPQTTPKSSNDDDQEAESEEEEEEACGR